VGIQQTNPLDPRSRASWVLSQPKLVDKDKQEYDKKQKSVNKNKKIQKNSITKRLKMVEHQRIPIGSHA
jgi:hypothetical protein